MTAAGCGARGPACWGPLQWSALHQMLRGYPMENASREKRLALEAYVRALTQLLPCSECGRHWAKLVDTIDTRNRITALRWSIDAHNAVNARLGKPVLSYAQAVAALMAQCPLATTQATALPESPSSATMLSAEASATPPSSCPKSPACPKPQIPIILACVAAAIAIVLAIVVGILAVKQHRHSQNTSSTNTPATLLGRNKTN
jgi:hypothetical protein